MERFVNVEVVDSPKLVLIIGCIGLVLNILSAIVVHGECSRSSVIKARWNVFGLSQITTGTDMPMEIPLPPIRSNSGPWTRKETILWDSIYVVKNFSRRENVQHATHNHRVEPPVGAPQHNLGLIGVLTHLLGDAINSEQLVICSFKAWPLTCLDIGVIIAAIIFMKLSSPKRFYADPAVSLAISFIIFGGSIPMSVSWHLSNAPRITWHS